MRRETNFQDENMANKLTGFVQKSIIVDWAHRAHVEGRFNDFT